MPQAIDRFEIVTAFIKGTYLSNVCPHKRGKKVFYMRKWVLYISMIFLRVKKTTRTRQERVKMDNFTTQHTSQTGTWRQIRKIFFYNIEYINF